MEWDRSLHTQGRWCSFSHRNLISAAGAVEAIAALACMEAGWAHPTINLDEPDPECDLDYVPRTARRLAQRHVLSNSFGFGGQNASLVLRHADA